MKIKPLDFISQALRDSGIARDLQERTRNAALTAVQIVREIIANGAGEHLEARSTASGPNEAAASGLLADHLGALVEKRLLKLAQCRRWKSADDPVEAVHDLRVSSRRLRAFVDTFEPLLSSEVRSRTEKPLRRITRAARAVRDLDVQVELLIARLDRAATDAERGALEHLLEQLEAGRARACRRAEKRLAKIDFDELTLSVSAALGETVERLPHDRAATAALAHELIEPLIEQASKDRPPDDGVEHPDEMHRLRIALKRLRYGLELFEPVFGGAYESLYGRVEGLQELLGKHHDLVVLCEVVEEHREKLEQKGRHTLLVGLETLGDQLMKERRNLLARFRAEGFEPDWWLRSVEDALAEV